MKKAECTNDEMIAWALQNPSQKSLLASHEMIKSHWGVGGERAGVVWRDAYAVASDLLASPENSANARLQHENARLEKLLGTTGDLVDLFASTYRQIVPTLPAFKAGERRLPKARKGLKQGATMMVDLSDWHYGQTVRADDIAGLGAYNPAIARDRLKMMCGQILNVYGEWSKVRPIDTLYINVLGDMVDGDAIFRGQDWFLSLDLVEQCEGAVFLLASMIRDLACQIPHVQLMCVPGNHGRAGGRKAREAAPPMLNNEILLYRMIQNRVSSLRGVKMFVARCPWLGYQLYKHNHLLVHGNATQMWNQIPFYGLGRDLMRNVAMMQVIWHYQHVAHFHQEGTMSVSGMRILLNGSVVGPNLFSAEKMKSATPASQRFYMVHPEHGVSWEMALTFDPPKPLTTDERGFFTPVDDGSAVRPLDPDAAGDW